MSVDYDDPLYHVAARGNGRQAIYQDEMDRRRFLVLLGEEIERNTGGALPIV